MISYKLRIDLLERYEIRSTLFVTTGFFERYPEVIKDASMIHEMGYHGSHSMDYNKLDPRRISEDIENNKKKIEEEINSKIIGFRAPRMATVPPDILKDLGIVYDSSIHPTFVPGRYNNLLKPRLIYRFEGLTYIPISVVPILRLPFSWLWFRNLGLGYAKACTNLCFGRDFYLNLYFHPWEFVSLSDWNIPRILGRNSGDVFLRMLDRYIDWLFEKDTDFITLRELNDIF